MKIRSAFSKFRWLLVAWLAIDASNALSRGQTTANQAQDGHRDMMEQLGLKSLRPGADANNQAAFDEAAANQYALESVGRYTSAVKSGGNESCRGTSAGPKADEPVPRTDENSKQAHQDLLRKARLGATTARIDVYFIGDSITRRWGCTDPQYRELFESWQENFFGWNAANFGWGGDTTSNILWRLDNGELEGLKPKVFVILAGTNNLGDSSGVDDAAEIARGIKAIIETCRRKAPAAKIILTAVFPRNDDRSKLPVIRRINELIAGYADGEHVRFLNVNDKLADAEGNVFDGMMADGLHLTRRGYEVWAAGLRPILTEWLGPPASVDCSPPPTGDPSIAGAKQAK